MRTLRRQARAAAGLDIKPSPFTDHVGSITGRDVVRAGMNGVRAVIHAAVLHKPHVGTRSQQEFVGSKGYHPAAFTDGPYPLAR